MKDSAATKMNCAPGESFRRSEVVALFSASTAARLAQSASGVALVLFLLERLDSPAAVGTVVAARSLPSLVAGPLSGAWLDRTSRRKSAFVSAQILLLATLLATLLLVGHAPVWVLVSLSLLGGVTGPVLTAGFTGLIQAMVPLRLLQRAYGAEAASYNVAGVAGPAIAGGLVVATSPETALAACIGLGVVALMALIRMQVPVQTSNLSDTSILLAVRSGISHLARNAPLRAATTATTLSAVGYGAMPVAFPLLAVAAGGHRAQGGLFFSAFAAGALMGSLRTVRRTSHRDPLPSVLIGVGLLAVGFCFVALAPTVPIALILTVLVGTFEGPVLAATFTLRALHTPEHFRNQVVVTAASLKGGAFALGALVAGVVASAGGGRAAVLVIAGAQALGLATGLMLLRQGTRDGAAAMLGRAVTARTTRRSRS